MREKDLPFDRTEHYVYFFPISSVEPASPSHEASFLPIKVPSVVSINRTHGSRGYGAVLSGANGPGTEQPLRKAEDALREREE